MYSFFPQDVPALITQSFQQFPTQISTVTNNFIRDFLLIWKQDVKVNQQSLFQLTSSNQICLLGWHYCDIDGRQATFLCPNGTQFSQAVFVCDWWFNVRCDLSPRLYSINARLYQRPKVNPTRPHRIITKQLVDDIFN